MKNSIVFIILCLCSPLSAMRGKCGMNMPNDNQCMSMTSQESMNNTYLLIQQGEYDNAYDTFIAGVDRNDETLGGFIFETIINGLRIFGYIKNFKIKDYGIPRASIDVIKNIDKADVISVFKAIYDIAHNKEQFANKSIAECFKSINATTVLNESMLQYNSGEVSRTESLHSKSHSKRSKEKRELMKPKK